MEKRHKFKSLQTFCNNEWMVNNQKRYRSVFESAEVDYIRIYNLQTNSLSQNSQQSPTHIFPMPCNEEFNIENLPTDANWKLNVFNSMGQLIKQQDLSNSFNTIQTSSISSSIIIIV